MAKEFNFDENVPADIPVIWKGKQYALKPASGGAAKQYKNARLACIARTDPATGKPTEFRNVGSLEPLLVSLCLFDEKGKRVPQNVLEESWPGHVITALHDAAYELSLLDETPKADAVTLLAEALQLPASPVGLAALHEFVESLTEERFEPLKAAFAPAAEERLKNSYESTPAGSE